MLDVPASLMLSGPNADIIPLPDKYLSFKRLTGQAAIEAGMPALINPELAQGEYIAAFGETKDTIEWQGTWVDPAAALTLHRVELKHGRQYPGLSFDASYMANEILEGRQEVRRIKARGKGDLWLWDGHLQWTYSTGSISPPNAPRGHVHALAFNWLCNSYRIEVVGFFLVNLPGKAEIKPVQVLQRLIIPGASGSA